RVAQALEAVQLERLHGIDRAELVGDEDLSAGPRDAGELRDGELRTPNVVQHSMAAREVELRVAEGKAHDVAFDEAHVRRRLLTPDLEVVRSRVDSDDLVDEQRERERQRSRATTRVESNLVPAERPEEPAHAVGEVGRALFLECQPQLDAHATPPSAASDRASSSASSRVE